MPTEPLADELSQLLLARHTLIAARSSDETVEQAAVLEVGRQLERNVHDWTITSGIHVYSHDVDESAVVGGTDKPELALQYLLRQRRPSIGCFRGLAPFTTQPIIRRQLVDYVQKADPERETLLLLDEESLHPRIQRLAVQWRPTLPGKQELSDIVQRSHHRLKLPMHGDEGLNAAELERLVQNLRGLTRSEARRIIDSVLLNVDRDHHDDLQRLIEAKRGLLESSGVLESMSVDFDINGVGGLRGLKRWLAARRNTFSERARKFGIEPPRGVLMLGVPGCGKSLCAKAVAADWGMPLLRLDPGLLYQKFVGESENQLRQAIQQAEAMAPVVLWIDEIEKAFASASSSSADGGLSQRMFGTLLSWMQEHRSPIFTIATANDISALPPELMRKGRFDEVFFIDLPGVDARRQIFTIHLIRKGREPDRFDVGELADASKDLTGSEIEQAIAAGLIHAFAAERELETSDIMTALAATNPLSTLMHEKIEALRDWASARCVAAD